MTTVTEVLAYLKENGYTVDFNLKENCLVCHGNTLEIRPEDFVVDKSYRFEGPSDPGDSAVVYAISSRKHDLKGVLVNGYGISSDPLTDQMVSALATKPENQESPGDTTALDTELAAVDLREQIDQLKLGDKWVNGDRDTKVLFKSDSLRIIMIGLHENAELKKHTAPGIITVQVLEGGITFSTETESINLENGQMLSLPAHIPHSVTAREESVFLLTICISS
ncbi:cupin domain-containing protein [Mucilaginibacter hurinus]|uniref:Cupin domain-containing protein n=2 Tax=Mucilaginibacter hurinus TaxID=2201324 RepID=A0A367GKY7_9SPHI|nr:cupin domain-containing protein [Mucilaginibacter hurinus]